MTTENKIEWHDSTPSVPTQPLVQKTEEKKGFPIYYVVLGVAGLCFLPLVILGVICYFMVKPVTA